MNIYLDVCCLNRPFDDQNQDRIHLEAEAVLSILSRCQKDEWNLAASEVIEWEISRSSNIEKREKVRILYALAKQSHRISITKTVENRAIALQQFGLKTLDSLHLASAEEGRQDVLLTTDDRFLSAAKKADPAITVANPVNWLMEVKKNG